MPMCYLLSVYARKGTAKKDDDVTLCRKDWLNCIVALIVDYFCVILPILLIFTVCFVFQ